VSSNNPSYNRGVVSGPLAHQDKDDLRERVLRASISLIEEQGLAGLSMREVARRAGVSHQAPYHYFPDRESILAAVAQRGFEMLDVRLRTARQQAGSPTEALEHAAIAYVHFACEHSAHFRIMFRPELVTLKNHQSADGCADQAFQHVPEMVIDCFKVGFPESVGVEVMSAVLWSTVHGIACLLVDGPLGEKLPIFLQDRDKAIRDVARAVRMMIESTITLAKRGP